MEPRIQYVQIQYATTKDGTSVAFYALGHGSPLIYTQGGPLTFLELAAAQATPYRSFLDELAKSRTVIAYERGKFAVSDKERENLLEAWAGELTAVADRLALDRFDLFGWGFHSPVAIAYAAWNPERVSRLVLFCPATRGSELIGSPRDRVLGMLMDTDWELWTEVVAHMSLGWDAGKAGRMFAASMREGSTPDEVRALFRAMARLDATELVSNVTCPVLILHSRRHPVTQTSVVRELAAKLPDARLTLLEGDSVSPYVGENVDALVQAINRFLGEPSGVTAAETGSERPPFRTILFTDVEGSTALTDRLGDAKARDLLREHERIVREALKTHGGSEVKALGDGFMTSFSSATKALECAIAMQRAFAERNESAEEPILVRVGLNAGEPIAEDEDLFGTAVILAARIAAKAEGGEILASEAVRQIVAGKKFPFSDRGETALRGFEDRVRIYQVSWREA